MSQNGNLDPKLAADLKTMYTEIVETMTGIEKESAALRERLDTLKKMRDVTNSTRSALYTLLCNFDVDMPERAPF